MSKPKIYVFINGDFGGRDVVGESLAEDGTFLTSHISSNADWFRHDMGLTSERKHDVYRAHYPEGFELVEVPRDELRTHVGLNEAYARHIALSALGYHLTTNEEA